jgi:hypothetical protein
MNDPYLIPPPPFELVQVWTPDPYDLTVLQWNPDGAYLLECGSVHADERLAQHDHGRVLALVVLEPEEDWVEEAIALGTPDPPTQEALA